jgi:hypothetical protein
MSALRALFDGLLVVAVLERRGVRPLVGSVSVHPPGDVVQASDISRAVDAGLAMLPIAFTCLRRSAVLLRELSRCGLGADLHIGVRQGPGGIEAHAWIQVADVVLNDDPQLIRTYVPLTLGDAERLGLRFA